jgi:hypothetical protein
VHYDSIAGVAPYLTVTAPRCSGSTNHVSAIGITGEYNGNRGLDLESGRAIVESDLDGAPIPP